MGSKKLSIEVGRLAKQADGAAFLQIRRHGSARHGNDVGLAERGNRLLPLMVDYEEAFIRSWKDTWWFP